MKQLCSVANSTSSIEIGSTMVAEIMYAKW